MLHTKLGNRRKQSERALGAEHPATLELLALLARIHLRREEYTDAEPLLLEPYQGIVKRQGENATPCDKRMLHEVLTSLVDVYDKTNQPEKEAEWKKQLAAVQEPAAEASPEERPQE